MVGAERLAGDDACDELFIVLIFIPADRIRRRCGSDDVEIAISIDITRCDATRSGLGATDDVCCKSLAAVILVPGDGAVCL